MTRTQVPLTYETQLRRAERALRTDNLFEARRWTVSALEREPEGSKAQELMARVIEREVAREKLLSSAPPSELPEEALPDEKKLQIKTWLERSRTFLSMNQFDQALLAAEEVFRLDPENRQASELLDAIHAEARRQGKEEGLFLENLYREEIEGRIQDYLKQAEARLERNQLGAAHLAIQKVLLLDPGNPQAQRLLAILKEKERGLP